MNRIIEYLIIGRKLNKTYNRYLGEVSEIYGLNRMEITSFNSPSGFGI